MSKREWEKNYWSSEIRNFDIFLNGLAFVKKSENNGKTFFTWDIIFKIEYVRKYWLKTHLKSILPPRPIPHLMEFMSHNFNTNLEWCPQVVLDETISTSGKSYCKSPSLNIKYQYQVLPINGIPFNNFYQILIAANVQRSAKTWLSPR